MCRLPATLFRAPIRSCGFKKIAHSLHLRPFAFTQRRSILTRTDRRKVLPIVRLEEERFGFTILPHNAICLPAWSLPLIRAFRTTYKIAALLVLLDSSSHPFSTNLENFVKATYDSPYLTYFGGLSDDSSFDLVISHLCQYSH